jgi:FkbM family methyltransferase
MYVYINHIKKLEKKVPKIDYLDIGSRGDILGWFKIIQKNLNVIERFEADDGIAIFNKKIEDANFFLTKKDPSRSSLFEPNKILSIYEKQSSRLDIQKKKTSTDTLDNLYLKKNIDLIKIDTQGSEYEIIDGGLNFIKKHKPLLFLETWSFEYYKDIKLFDQIITKLKTINYELYGLDIAASHRIDLIKSFGSNLGSERHTGFNIFMAPNLDEIKKLDIEKRIKISFIFFVNDLISHAYFLIDDIQNSEFKTQMEILIKKRIKYKKFYKLMKIIHFANFKFFGINKNFFKLT